MMKKPIETRELLKERLIEVLRKTGHISEEALGGVADVVIETTFGFGQEQ